MIPNGGSCDSLGGAFCAFGNSCYKGICTAWGTVPVGEEVIVTDDFQGQAPFKYNQEFLCESFNTLQVKVDGVYKDICAWGDEPRFN